MRPTHLFRTLWSALALVSALAIGCGDDDGGGTGGGTGETCSTGLPAACDDCICTNCASTFATCEATDGCVEEANCIMGVLADGTCTFNDVFGACGNTNCGSFGADPSALEPASVDYAGCAGAACAEICLPPASDAGP